MRLSIRRAGGFAAPRLAFDLQEWSGAFGDLGLLIPVVAALVIKNGFDGTSVLLVFGAAYILSALYYRLPMPVQPLKAMAAIIIAQGLGVEVVSAAGLLMAAVLLTLAATGAIGPLSRLFTRPVVRGIQVAVGLLLIKTAVDMATSGQVLRGHDDVYLSFGADVPVSLLLALGTAAVVTLSVWKRGLPAGLIVLALGVVAGLAFGSAGMLSGLSVGPQMPSLALPGAGAFATALVVLVIPQVPLTVGNAVVACTDTAHGYFGEGASRVTHRSLLTTMGLANMFAGAVGGMPVCHGSGGLTAHYRFGARTAAAGLIIGSALVALALTFGSGAVDLFGLIPYPVLGVMLGVVGVQHALLARDCRRVEEVAVVATVALTSVALGNVAIGFAAGMALHFTLAGGQRALARSGLLARGREAATASARDVAAAREG
ncbi:MAG: putative sulfate/molybdate transporter [Dehalococcoidia bacterium]|nr:putative sulfate/molybdate transporter [Dehalococcoidia bacterium]